MRADGSDFCSALLGFLLVLRECLGLIIFVPLPGMRHCPDLARVALALTLSLLLLPAWPVVSPDEFVFSQVAH